LDGYTQPAGVRDDVFVDFSLQRAFCLKPRLLCGEFFVSKEVGVEKKLPTTSSASSSLALLVYMVGAKLWDGRFMKSQFFAKHLKFQFVF
jgi:hypothetical protein